MLGKDVADFPRNPIRVVLKFGDLLFKPTAHLFELGISISMLCLCHTGATKKLYQLLAVNSSALRPICELHALRLWIWLACYSARAVGQGDDGELCCLPWDCLADLGDRWRHMLHIAGLPAQALLPRNRLPLRSMLIGEEGRKDSICCLVRTIRECVKFIHWLGLQFMFHQWHLRLRWQPLGRHCCHRNLGWSCRTRWQHLLLLWKRFILANLFSRHEGAALGWRRTTFI
mmetsp:Transcript_23653/g.42815  ORF Transcript_23653/g.42815 Transcript_23653/m.42815 type:complete len:230 (-) Transcript_23653:217-906(-)